MDTLNSVVRLNSLSHWCVFFSLFFCRVLLSSTCTYCSEQVGNDAKITIEHLNINCHPSCFKVICLSNSPLKNSFSWLFKTTRWLSLKLHRFHLILCLELIKESKASHLFKKGIRCLLRQSFKLSIIFIEPCKWLYMLRDDSQLPLHRILSVHFQRWISSSKMCLESAFAK